MPKEQFDLFEQPPANLARAFSSEQVSTREWKPKDQGEALYEAAQELITFTAYLKLNDWQHKYLWPHLQSLLKKMKEADSDHKRWFELGYIISAMEVEQLRSRSSAAEICKKYGVQL